MMRSEYKDVTEQVGRMRFTINISTGRMMTMPDEVMIADYHLRKKYHYCVTCGKQDAYTLRGRSRCFECAERRNELSRARVEYNQKLNGKHMLLYYERKSSDLCVRCGKPAENGKTRCKACAYRARKYTKPKELNRSLAAELGICVKCLKLPAKNGYKLCENCYEKAVKSLETGRSRIKNRQPLIFGKLLCGGADNA